MKKVFITGTSRGLGRTLVTEFNTKGYKVISTARNLDSIKDQTVYKKIELDVTNPDSIKKAVGESGDIDILINNAAYTVAGPIEIIPIEEIRKEYETNVIGPLLLSREFIPGMRKKGKGKIVNISSVADRFAPPYGGSYSSAKAALAMITEAMHFELNHFGIDVILIEAGAIKTEMPIRQRHYSSEDYNLLEDQMQKRFKEYFKVDNRTSPDEIARNIAEIIELQNPNLKYPVGNDANYMLQLYREKSDIEWENDSPLYKGLNW